MQHAIERGDRLEKAIEQAIEQAPASMRELVEAVQSLRGVAMLRAVTIVSE